MGDGFQKLVGDRLRNILDCFISNLLMGVLVGIIVMVLIQSSFGIMVIIVGFVSVGFMMFCQVIGVIMGVNIGIMVIVFIIGIDIGVYVLLIIVVGGFLLFFFKYKNV